MPLSIFNLNRHTFLGLRVKNEIFYSVCKIDWNGWAVQKLVLLICRGFIKEKKRDHWQVWHLLWWNIWSNVKLKMQCKLNKYSMNQH